MDFAAFFVPVQGCVFFLICTGAGSLLLCVTCKKPSKREGGGGGGGTAEASKGQK